MLFRSAPCIGSRLSPWTTRAACPCPDLIKGPQSSLAVGLGNLPSLIRWFHRTSFLVKPLATLVSALGSLLPSASSGTKADTMQGLWPWLICPHPFSLWGITGVVHSNISPNGSMCACSVAQSFETPWTIDCEAPLSVGFSRQEYWSGLPFPSPGALPDPGILHPLC